MAYDGHTGVKYRRYADDHNDGDEPLVDTGSATLDELYFSSYSGELEITVETPEGYIGLNIPVKPDGDWNEFVESLPKWTNE
jgi:hypothetical protein